MGGDELLFDYWGISRRPRVEGQNTTEQILYFPTEEIIIDAKELTREKEQHYNVLKCNYEKQSFLPSMLLHNSLSSINIIGLSL